MKKMIKILTRIIAAAFIALIFMGMISGRAYAKPLDEILDYEVYADVNQDATVNFNYHIKWKVLDSDSEGPLSWVRIGIPNSHYGEMMGLTDNIKSMGYDSDGGSYVRIDFDRDYYEDEVIDFEFSVVQDYMYQVDKFEDGYTVYTYTPSWFDEITIDHMKVVWDGDKADGWDPSCLTIAGNLVWEKEDMEPGEKITINVTTYPNDAFGFDTSKKIEDGYNDDSSAAEDLFYMIGLLFVVVFPIGVAGAVFRMIMELAYRASAFFGSGGGKQITRTKIVYFDSCPGCGAVREEGKETCAYCGRSMIKSKEKIEEKDIRGAERAAAGFDKEGTFKYTDAPNTYLQVHVVPMPRPRSSYFSSSSSGRSHRSSHHSSHRSSCAHSSCACACACACAGGGRAGCSAKDFYKTDLKASLIRGIRK